MATFMTRCGKRWYPLASRNSSVCFRSHGEVWASYANLIDYLRIVIALVGVCLVPQGQPVAVGVLLILSFLLDWLDGPVARFMNQCTYLGASLDWYGDVLTNILQAYWFAHVSPLGYFGNVVMWIFLFVELGYMMLDTICYAQGRYPDVSERCLNAVLKLSVRPGTHGALYMYTDFYALIWFVFPLFTATLCIEKELQYVPVHQHQTHNSFAYIAADLWIMLMKTVGSVLSLVFIVTEVELGRLLFLRWTEPRDLPSNMVRAAYSDIERNVIGGCLVLRSVASALLTPEDYEQRVLPVILCQLPSPASDEKSTKRSRISSTKRSDQGIAAFARQTARDKAGLVRAITGGCEESKEWTTIARDTLVVCTAKTSSKQLVGTLFDHKLCAVGATSVQDVAAVTVPPLGPGDAVFYLAGTMVRVNSSLNDAAVKDLVVLCRE